MMWSLFISAMGLVLVFEGILPFLSPTLWRQMLKQVFVLPDHIIRVMGFLSMTMGLGLVCLVHYFF